jgi:hypothetical protein
MRECGFDILLSQIRILRDNLVRGVAGFFEPADRTRRDARASNDSGVMAYVPGAFNFPNFFVPAA